MATWHSHLYSKCHQGHPHCQLFLRCLPMGPRPKFQEGGSDWDTSGMSSFCGFQDRGEMIGFFSPGGGAGWAEPAQRRMCRRERVSRCWVTKDHDSRALHRVPRVTVRKSLPSAMGQRLVPEGTGRQSELLHQHSSNLTSGIWRCLFLSLARVRPTCSRMCGLTPTPAACLRVRPGTPGAHESAPSHTGGSPLGP